MADAPSTPAGEQPLPQFPGGTYAVQGVLGAGGMAVVYRARDLRHGRDVAIKVLRVGVAEAIGTERFLREIAVTAAFTHPHILPLLDSGEAVDADGRPTPFYVMPLIAGEPLSGHLRARHRLPVEEAVRLAGEILEALRYAHDHGVIHRDIKPANVLLSGGHAVVADFGVARLVRGEALVPPGGSMTATGVALGTPAYMSPEQAMGDSTVDARCDLYAVGCVLYEMLCGASPFDAPTPQAFIARKFGGTLQPVSQLRPDVPPGTDDVLACAMALEPAKRFPTAGAFLEALARLDVRAAAPSASGPAPDGPAPVPAASPPFEATPAFPSGPTPPRWRALAGGMAGAALLAAGIWMARPQSRNRSDEPEAAKATTRIAVLPPEILGIDTSVATTLHGDVIDELANYPALTVISRNGMAAFSPESPTDRVAQTLRTGSVITWRVRGAGDSVWVTARLIDGATDEQVASYAVVGRRREVLTVRSALVDSVTRFLRRQLGIRLRSSAAAQAANSEAWDLVIRADALLRTVRGMSPGTASATLTRSDSLLAQAQRLDPGWYRPVERRVSLRLTRAMLALRPADRATDESQAARLLREAIRVADAAMAGLRDSTPVLVQRGRTRLELWTSAVAGAPDSLRMAAEVDLRAAVGRRPEPAMAWYWLSQLYETNGEFELARDAVVRARSADAFLQRNDELLSRMMFVDLALGRVDAAERHCRQGLAQYPDSPQFWDCELTLLAWSATRLSDLDRAWVALRDAEQRDRQGILATYAGQRLLKVAAVAARVGRGARARELVDSSRAIPAADAVATILDLHEAHVRVILREPDRARALLARYVSRNPAYRGFIRHHPWFASLARDASWLARGTVRQADRPRATASSALGPG
jgi:serine/threonine-protein kinase